MKKLLMLLLAAFFGKKMNQHKYGYKKYSSSDYKKRGRYGYGHYKKKYTSHSFFSS